MVVRGSARQMTQSDVVVVDVVVVGAEDAEGAEGSFASMSTMTESVGASLLDAAAVAIESSCLSSTSPYIS